MADEEPFSNKRKLELSESQTTAQQPAVARVWRVDDKAADILRDVRWKLSENHLEGAKKILETHKIETVSQLKDMIVGDDSQQDQECPDALNSLFSTGRQWGDLVKHLCNSIQESSRPEEILNRKILNEDGSILDEAVSQEKEFTADAIAVRNPDTTQRQFDIRIVQGPSGSGKTVYTINRLAFVDDAGDGKKVVCIYYSLSEHSASKYTPQTFVSRIKQVLQKALKQGSDGKWQWDPMKKTKLNMRVSLILDEAGALDSILDNREVLTGIYNEIGSCATSPRLILAGTGYDKTPKGLSSANDIHKYQMRPWAEKNLALVARKRYPENYDGERFVEEIIKYPLLTRLITNARAAVFTLDAVKQLKKGHPIIKLRGSIGTVIQMVIGRYTAFNGIGMLTARQQKALAYAVFHELNLDNKSTAPHFPEFNTILTLEEEEQGAIKRQAQGVVDLLVETSSGVGGETTTSFVDEDSRLKRRSVSITPAMSMLLYNLLGVDATIYDNWEGLEVTTALHAVYLEVLDNTTTQELGVEIARLTKAVPPPGANKNIYIPSQVTTPTIFINGNKAPFFDVITNFRGLQAKHSQNGEKIDLYLGEEMQKCGLLKERLPNAILTRKGVDTPDEEGEEEGSGEEDSEEVSEDAAAAAVAPPAQELEEEPKRSKDEEKMVRNGAKAFKMGNATLAAFLHTWNGIVAPSNDGNAKERESVRPRFLSPAFCFPTSGRADTEVVPSLHFTVDKEGSVMFDDRMIDPVEFGETLPFEMIFVTNAQQIRLLPKQNGKAIVIDAESVDADGVLTTEPDGYDEYLKALKPRENVQVRFVFTGHEN